MTPSDTGPPEDVPDEVVDALETCSDRELREVIHYAQGLLREENPLTNELEPREGEEIVRTEDHGSYTYVVVERPEETGQASGPYAYRVKWEPDIDDEDGGKYRWHFLGHVDTESGGE